MSTNIITNNNGIYQYFKKIGFILFFKYSIIMHMIDFVNASTTKGYNGSIVDVVNLSYSKKHRTTIGKMLNNEKFDIEKGWIILREEVMRIIVEEADKRAPLFAILDDTLAEKAKPSSKAKSFMQGGSYHKSHTKGKTKIWGHQYLSMILSKGNHKLPYHMERYVKESKSKIELAGEMIEELPISDGKDYVMYDSWFTNGELIKKAYKRGYNTIGALRTNRVIYPKGIGIQIKEFAKYVSKNDVYPVKVNGRVYYTYRYEGNLNGIENAVVILTWPKKKFDKKETVCAFLCTDMELSTKEILHYYSSRWPIEIYFRNSKSNLGLDMYRVRSTKAIDSIIFLNCLTYLYCCSLDNEKSSFNKGLRKLRKKNKMDEINYIYKKAQQGFPIELIYSDLKVC